jgi:two-component system chemotaxis response regulator CheY
MNIKLRALVVDDSKVMRHMVMETLKKTDLAEFEFAEAVDGQDALTKLQEQDFHVAFIDWNMPNMTGVEVVRAARLWAGEQKREPIPMVMVTSEKALAKVQEAVDVAGAEAFISKPFTVAEMQAKLERVVKKAVDVRLRAMRGTVSAEAALEPAPPTGGFFSKLFG